MTALIVILVVLVVVLVAAFLVIQRKNRQANIARADQLRHQAATEAQATIAPAQERAAVAQAQAEEARAAAARAEAEAREAQVAAQQVEATHEDQLRAADRLDPRVDETSDDYAPQVPGTVAQEPTAPADVNAEPEATSTDSPEDGGRPPLLPRRTPGAQEMPGKPIEGEGGGGWFTKG